MLVNYTETFDFLLHLAKVQHHYSSTNAFQALFRVKSIARLFLKCENSQSHMISNQSLLLSTTVLDDEHACTNYN